MAPLLEERERFLLHLQREGTSRFRLKLIAPVLIQVARFLDLKKLRDVRVDEIQKAAERWQNHYDPHRPHVSETFSKSYFVRFAKSWLRFHHRLIVPLPTPPPFKDKLSTYLGFLRQRGLSAETIRARTSRLVEFLRWFSKRHRNFAKVSLNDVDRFLAFQSTNGWSRGTVAAAAVALKSFFLFAAGRRWCRDLASGIKWPSAPKYHFPWEGPSWKEVCLLLRDTPQIRPADIRARAVISLLAVYGLRASEVTRLVLADLDWQEKTLSVRHLKRGRFQRFPIQREVGDAVQKYITKVRPTCSPEPTVQTSMRNNHLDDYKPSF